MAEEKYYLSASAFFNFILSSRNKNAKIKQPDVLLKLLSIYMVRDYNGTGYARESISTIISNFKKGTDLPRDLSKFCDTAIRENFFSDIQSKKPCSLEMMKDFVEKIIDSDRYLDLVKSLLRLIERDKKITEEEAFYLFEIKQYVNKETFCQFTYYNIESFLLSIWLYIIRYRYKSVDNNTVSYIDGDYNIRSYVQLKRDVKVCRYDDRNKELLEEYGKFKVATPTKTMAFDSIKDYKVEEDPSPDEDLMLEFRDDYNKILKFIIDLDLDAVSFEFFIRFDFYQFSNRISELKNKWDDKISSFVDKEDRELAGNIIDELDVFVSSVKDSDKRSLRISKNKINRYYSDLPTGVTFDNLYNT